MTLREEIIKLLAQANMSQYRLCQQYNSTYNDRLERTNLASYIKGKDTVSAKKLDKILALLRSATTETSTVTFSGSEIKKIWENKSNPNQRLSFEKTERHISFTVSDADNPKYLVLLYIERLYNDTDDIAKVENDFMQFVNSQIDAEWEEIPVS